MADDTSSQTRKEEKRAKLAAKKAEAAAKKAESMQHRKTAAEGFELVRLRNNFYRDNYRLLILLLTLSVFIIILLSSLVFYMYSHRPQPRYFATNIEGQIVQLQPLNKPAISTADLLGWVARGAGAAFTFNYASYQEQIEHAKDTYFTNSGGKQYLQALEDSRDLDAIKQGKIVVTAVASQAPVIKQQGVISSGSNAGRYGWDIVAPTTVTFQSANVNRSVVLDIEMLVVRSSEFIDEKATSMDAVRGIGIAQFLAKSENNRQASLVRNLVATA